MQFSRVSKASCIAATLLVLALALLAAPAPSSAAKPKPYYKYTTKLHPTYTIPPKTKPSMKPSGSAVVSIYNSTYAEVAFVVKNIANAYMAHIHNGTVAMPGPVIIWAFESTLPSGGFNPISGEFGGMVAFNPTATGVAGLLDSNQAYFNVHTTAYPSGAISGDFK